MLWLINKYKKKIENLSKLLSSAHVLFTVTHFSCSEVFGEIDNNFLQKFPNTSRNIAESGAGASQERDKEKKFQRRMFPKFTFRLK